MAVDANTKASVEAFIASFMKSYRDRDLDGLLALLPPDDDIYMFGTGKDEVRQGRQEFKYQAERDWAQTEALDFSLEPTHISAAGTVAWIAAEGVGKGKAGGQAFEFPMRMTTVLEQQNGKWLMVQAHISLPSIAQEDGDSVPV